VWLTANLQSLILSVGPEQGLPQVVYKAWSCARAMAPKKVMKVAMKKVTKKPSGNPPVPNKDEEMSLEDKMELFVRSKQQNVANWLDTLTKGQRETLWQRFSRARDGLKDPVVNKGSIVRRRDPEDTSEWQFCLKKEQKWEQTETKHEHKGHQVGKQEAVSWMKLKAAAGVGTQEGNATEALEAVCGRKGKAALAIEDGNAKESEDESPAKPASSKKKKKKQDADEVEADVLSDMGGTPAFQECKVRVSKMLKLLQKVRKEVGSSHDACLREPESALKALLKKKASAEVAKKKLFDCALAIKKAKRSENHVATQMTRRFCESAELGVPQPYIVELPIQARSSEGWYMTSKPLGMFLPHEWFSWLENHKEASGFAHLEAFWEEHSADDPKLAGNPIVKEGRHHFLPMVLHGDGGQFHRGDSIHVISLRSLLSKAN
ncbi:unnamed protein product, partial [Durusdinium trenchii]